MKIAIKRIQVTSEPVDMPLITLDEKQLKDFRKKLQRLCEHRAKERKINVSLIYTEIPEEE
ncbi:MAG: hypothetical protein V1904_06235 [Bacteroidota bacterium]